MPSPDWIVERREDAWVVCSRLVLGLQGVGHAFSTRGDGTANGSFDVGPARAATELQRSRRRALCRAAGLGDREPTVVEQLHGSRVLVARDAAAGGDALVATRADDPRAIVAIRSADCAPIVVVAQDGSALAAIHAGWRGAAAGVVSGAIGWLEQSGIPPSRLVAAVGPAIGPCCYEVGLEVARAVTDRSGVTPDRFVRRNPSGRLFLDLPGTIAHQLVQIGVPPSAVTVAPWCTACHSDLFFSHRRDGAPTGRMMAVVGWRIGVP